MILNWIKSYKKTIITIILIALIGTSVGLLFVNWSNLQIIYSAGSSAVYPLFEELNIAYKQGTDKNVDMNVLPTGSGNGLESIANSLKDLGNMSRSPTIKETGLPSINGKDAISGIYSKSWIDNELKTITWGWDAICIVYKPLNKDFVMDINQSNIQYLFNCVSGNQSYTLNDFKKQDSIVNDNTVITPYARTGGAVKSGTTEAFLTSTHLNINSDSNSYHDIEIGNYGGNVKTTNESNVSTWIQVKDGPVGSLTYLSGGFVLKNINDIYANGFKVATYNNIELSEENITNGYNWFRPLNSIMSINAPNYVKDWVFWVINELYNWLDKKENGYNTENNLVIQAFKNVNVVLLTKQQLLSMCNNNEISGFWASDYTLFENGKSGPFGASEG